VPQGYQLIRTTTKPSKALCDLNTYTVFLLAESRRSRLYTLGRNSRKLSHESVNRFLLREQYDPKDLFDEIKLNIDLIGGTLSGDDKVIDKPYSARSLTQLIGYFWQGLHHRVVKAIQLITLYYTDPEGKSVPINYRIYDKQEGKTKNDYFRILVHRYDS